MICREIIEIIEKRYPKRYAMDWDNVGLLTGRYEKDVQKIYIALDATDEVIEEAVRYQADLLITHHPMIFRGMKKISDDDFIGRRVIKLIQNDISYYAMHTNYDVMGMADLAGEILRLESPEVLEVTSVEGDADGTVEGIGRVSDLTAPMSLRECCAFVKERFVLPSVKVFGDPEKQVSRMGVFPGSGKSAIEVSLAKGVDVLVTGDIDHHEGIDAVARGMAVIDAGHYGVEHIFIADMRGFCESHFPHISVETTQIQHPFWTM